MNDDGEVVDLTQQTTRAVLWRRDGSIRRQPGRDKHQQAAGAVDIRKPGLAEES